MAQVEGDSEVTKESSQLSVYEKVFINRYTEDDAEYMRTVRQPNPPPPCVDNWYTRPKRTYDWTRNPSDNRGRGAYNRPCYGGDSHSGVRYGRDDRYTGAYQGRRDYLPERNNAARAQYAGLRDQYAREAPAPKYNRQSRS